VNPVGPAAQPEKFAVAISNTTPGSAAITAPTNQCGVAASSGTPGLVNLIDFSGDDLLTTVSVGVNPCYLQLDAGGDTGYTLNGDGTTNSFGITTSLIQSQVNQTTLPSGAAPVAILPQTTNLYIAESGLNAVAQLTQTSPPAFKQNLPTGQNTVYTVGVASAPRVYAISQGANGSVGTVAAIETNSNTISSTIPVGRGPVYGVMTADSRRAFILNKTDGTVSVINSQTNALDTFNNVTTNAVTSTIPVGNAPVWADFAPPLTELVVANQGNGTTAGSVSIISIPLCTASTVTSNPNCDPANPVDAVGFGQVVATIPVGINPVMVAVLQDGSQAFVANQGNATTPGSISVINLATDTVVATLPAGASTNELDSIVHGHPTWISATTGTPTGKVYVTSSDSTDLTIIRTDTDTVQTHLTLQGTGISVRVSAP
jgi:DNA-binding beta-propeller fold protein YncE